ncbi:MAG: dephospho-CoA kinase [Salinivirgaceae bacterium]|nr:dephospho-CoA kinase [Salinivirgaceae bacterium]
MQIVGLTGNIGSGKTFVANLFANKNIAIYNSDEKAKFLMNNNFELKQKIIEKFGSDSYQNNSLNKKYIADQIFNNKVLLEWMNQLIHPAVKTDFESWVNTNNDFPYVIKEAAILIESKAYLDCDSIILVTAPEKIRIKRVMSRDNLTEDQVSQRILNQMTEIEKEKYADFIIKNDGTLVVKDQVDSIHEKLIQRIL